MKRSPLILHQIGITQDKALAASLMAHALPVIAMVLLNNKLQLLMVKETGQIHHIFLLDALIPLKHL